MNLHFRKGSSGDDGEGSLLAMLLGLSGPPVADGRSLPLTLSFNMWWAPDNGYQPRLADPRVGFFTVDYFDVTKMKEVDRNVRLINRFDLKKNTASRSEPVEPIVWYLDHSVPEEYKAAVKEGILFWNKAFEKLGYINAIQVKDAPNDPDWDHADGRFNVIRGRCRKVSLCRGMVPHRSGDRADHECGSDGGCELSGGHNHRVQRASHRSGWSDDLAGGSRSRSNSSEVGCQAERRWIP
ncbi:MAG: DUF5117 domain-containing protein [Fimbriimonadaceae bacterium]